MVRLYSVNVALTSAIPMCLTAMVVILGVHITKVVFNCTSSHSIDIIQLLSVGQKAERAAIYANSIACIVSVSISSSSSSSSSSRRHVSILQVVRWFILLLPPRRLRFVSVCLLVCLCVCQPAGLIKKLWVNYISRNFRKGHAMRYETIG